MAERTARTARPGHNHLQVRPIQALNDSAATRDEFADALRPLFEAAQPLAEGLYAARPFSSYAELIDRAESLAHEMSFEDQAKVLAAHPRIGAPAASVCRISSSIVVAVVLMAAPVPRLDRAAAAAQELERRVLTARDIAFRDLAPGAVVAGLGWLALQSVGGYYMTHQLRGASQTYGMFAIVIGLLTPWMDMSPTSVPEKLVPLSLPVSLMSL